MNTPHFSGQKHQSVSDTTVSFDFSFLSILSVRTNHRITVLTCRKAREKLQCLYENRMSHNFRKAVVLKLKLRKKE